MNGARLPSMGWDEGMITERAGCRAVSRAGLKIVLGSERSVDRKIKTNGVETLGSEGGRETDLKAEWMGRTGLFRLSPSFGQWWINEIFVLPRLGTGYGRAVLPLQSE